MRHPALQRIGYLIPLVALVAAGDEPARPTVVLLPVPVTAPSASEPGRAPETSPLCAPGAAGQTLFGEVRERRTEHGALMAGVRVEIASGPDAGRAAITDSLGRYRLESLTAADVLVRARSAGFVDEIVSTSLCGDRQLEIRLTPANARFEGTVFDTTSAFAPLEGAAVEVVSGLGAGQKTVTDSAGHYVFAPVYGRLTVRASKSGYTSEDHNATIGDPVSYWNFGLKRQ